MSLGGSTVQAAGFVQQSWAHVKPWRAQVLQGRPLLSCTRHRVRTSLITGLQPPGLQPPCLPGKSLKNPHACVGYVRLARLRCASCSQLCAKQHNTTTDHCGLIVGGGFVSCVCNESAPHLHCAICPDSTASCPCWRCRSSPVATAPPLEGPHSCPMGCMYDTGRSAEANADSGCRPCDGQPLDTIQKPKRAKFMVARPSGPVQSEVQPMRQSAVLNLDDNSRHAQRARGHSSRDAPPR